MSAPLLKPSLLTLAMYATLAHAASVRNDIDLQTYRDFAENKGEFEVGATDVAITDKKGNDLGTILPIGVPIPDFSAASVRTGILTLVAPQHTTTVQHNINPDLFSWQTNNGSWFAGQGFGANDIHHVPQNHYMVVNRNDFETALDANGAAYRVQQTQFNNPYPTTENEPIIGQQNDRGQTVIDMEGNFAKYDLALPRLHKMVTEVVPVATPQYNPKDAADELGNYIAFARVGAGNLDLIDPNDSSGKRLKGVHAQDKQFFTDLAGVKQKLQDPTSITPEQKAELEYRLSLLEGGGGYFTYRFLTGGMPSFIRPSGVRIEKSQYETNENTYYADGDYYSYKDAYSDKTAAVGYAHDGSSWKEVPLPLASFAQSGDSGSGLYGFNSLTGKWEFVGMNQAGTGRSGKRVDSPYYNNIYTLFSKPYFEKVIGRDIGATINANGNWQQKDKDTQLGGQPLKAHKDVLIDGDVTITLDGNIDQKSGSIYVGYGQGQQPSNVTIAGSHSHTGGGIDVAEGSSVIYEPTIKAKISVYPQTGEQDEYLAKLGGGELTIGGEGNNQGGISIGDGTVYLDKKGQAARYVELVSGRGKAVLNKADQIKDGDVRFGHKGGVLDLNGQTMTSIYMHSADDGGVIVNNSDTKSVLTYKGQHTYEASTRTFVSAQQPQGQFEEYKYIVIGDGTMQPPQNSDDINYIYLGKKGAPEVATKLAKFNQEYGNQTAFAGKLGKQDGGNFDFVFEPQESNAHLLLTGGSTLTGDIIAKKGTLTLAGRPVPRAFDHINQREFDVNKNKWINRDYQAGTIQAEGNATIQTARGARQIITNLFAKDNATLDLGYNKGDNEKVCVRSDYNGLLSCEYSSSTNLDLDKKLRLTGDVRLQNTAQANLANAQWAGTIHLENTAQANLTNTEWKGLAIADTDTNLKLKDSTWKMTKNSTVGHLDVENATLVLSDGSSKDAYHILTAQTLSGNNSTIEYRADLAKTDSDKVVVIGEASGTHKLKVDRQGTEPKPNTNSGKLELLKVGTNKGLNVSLEGSADLGAFRYGLTNDGKEFTLEPLARPAPAPVVPPTTPAPTTPAPSVQPPVNVSTPTPAPAVPAPAPTTPAQPMVIAQKDMISRYTNAAVSDLSLQSDALAELGAHISASTLEQGGAWLQAGRYSTTYQSGQYRPYERTHSHQQAGANYKVGAVSYGAMFSRSGSTARLADAMNAQHDSYAASAFGRYAQNGSIIALDAGVGSVRANIAGVQTERRLAMAGISASHRFGMDKFAVIPSAYGRYGYAQNSNYRLEGADVRLDPTHLRQLGGEVRVQGAMQAGGLDVRPSAYVGFAHNNAALNASVNGYRFEGKVSTNRHVGLGLALGKGNLSASINAEKHFSKDFEGQMQATVRLGYRW